MRHSSIFVLIFFVVLATAVEKRVQLLIPAFKEVENQNEYSIEDGPYGGHGGEPWSDGNEMHLNGPITAIEVKEGDVIDAIRVRYKTRLYFKISCSFKNDFQVWRRLDPIPWWIWGYK